VPTNGTSQVVLWPKLALPGLFSPIGFRADRRSGVAQSTTHHRDDPVNCIKVEPIFLSASGISIFVIIFKSIEINLF